MFTLQTHTNAHTYTHRITCMWSKHTKKIIKIQTKNENKNTYVSTKKKIKRFIFFLYWCLHLLPVAESHECKKTGL